MNWNDHYSLKGLHSFLSPSKYHWINYDADKMVKVYNNYKAAERGTKLHEFAANAIALGIKLPRSAKTLNLYVNDAIGFRMTPEVCLFYSRNAFGTADAISFRKNKLRIHDLKTGVIPGSLYQLEIYASLFCLEYDKSPNDIDYEFRMYQSDEVIIHQPSPTDILYIMGKIREFDSKIEEINQGGY